MADTAAGGRRSGLPLAPLITVVHPTASKGVLSREGPSWAGDPAGMCPSCEPPRLAAASKPPNQNVCLQ